MPSRSRSILVLAVVMLLLLPTLAFAAPSTNGRAGATGAFYDDVLRTINLKRMPANAIVAIHAHNPSFNIIYMSAATLPGGGSFVPVIDAIQEGGKGFNPLWEEQFVTFNAGVTPFQLTSDTAVLAARDAGLITLRDTDQIDRCAVLGSNK